MSRRSSLSATETGIAVFGVLMLIPITLIYCALASGFVLQTLWSWFFTPLGLPPIGLALSIGISITVSYLTYHYTGPSQSKAEWPDIIALSIRPWVTLVFGWLVHLAM